MEKVNCEHCIYADYFGDYSLWWCDRYSITIENKYDYCEGFCPSQMFLEDYFNGKEV